MKNWKNKEFETPIDPDTEILVWSIEPHPYDSSYDSFIELDYAKAMDAAKDAAEHLMEISDSTKLKEKGVAVKISLLEITYADYCDLTDL